MLEFGLLHLQASIALNLFLVLALTFSVMGVAPSFFMAFSLGNFYLFLYFLYIIFRSYELQHVNQYCISHYIIHLNYTTLQNNNYTIFLSWVNITKFR